MGSAKNILVKPIKSQLASALIKRVHYSGKVTTNSQLSLGVYYAGKLEGAMQFGPPLDRRKVLHLVKGTAWNQVLELNRMAFTDALPRNSESRALGIAFRMFKKHRPDIKWILSFSDATQCGDGTIYRASGFLLTGIKQNTGVFQLPTGEVVQRMSLETASPSAIQKRLRAQLGMYTQPAAALVKAAGGRPIPGYQMRYIKFLDPAWVDRLTVNTIPFEQIPDDVRMYRGKKMRRPTKRDPEDHSGKGGADPTPTLHSPTHLAGD